MYGLETISGSSKWGKGKGPPITPDESMFLTFRLDEMYRLSNPGTFRINVSALHFYEGAKHITLTDSNSIVVTLTK